MRFLPIGLGSVFVLYACGSDGGSSASPSSANDAGATSSSSSSGSVGDAAASDVAAPGADVCATSPALPAARPSSTTTGVPAGVTLTPSGDITVTQAGTVIDGKDVTGRIDIQANDVTIQNCKVHTTGGPNDIGISVADGVTGTRVLHSEVFTDQGGYIGIAAAKTFVCATYVHGYENGMTVGGGMVIQANFIERLKSGQADPHYDGIEVYGGGAPSKLWGNHIRMTDADDKWLGETGAINLTAWQDDIDDVEMNGNALGGGSYTLYVDEQGGFKATNVRITGTVFFKDTAAYGTHLIRRAESVTTFTGNALDDGTPVAK